MIYFIRKMIRLNAFVPAVSGVMFFVKMYKKVKIFFNPCKPYDFASTSIGLPLPLAVVATFLFFRLGFPAA